MKLFVLIFFLLTFLAGCGIHIRLGDLPPEPYEEKIVDIEPVYIRVYCRVCGECVPEFVSIVCQHMMVETCWRIYCCGQTGEEFSIIIHNENEEVIDEENEPEPDYPDKFDSTRIKDDRGQIKDPPKPPRMPPVKKPRAKSYSGLAKRGSDN
jgi:hypothetical protein